MRASLPADPEPTPAERFAEILFYARIRSMVDADDRAAERRRLDDEAAAYDAADTRLEERFERGE